MQHTVSLFLHLFIFYDFFFKLTSYYMYKCLCCPHFSIFVSIFKSYYNWQVIINVCAVIFVSIFKSCIFFYLILSGVGYIQCPLCDYRTLFLKKIFFFNRCLFSPLFFRVYYTVILHVNRKEAACYETTLVLLSS
jgi:hypothetical protein